MEVWTIIRNDEKYGYIATDFPVRIVASGTLEQARGLACCLNDFLSGLKVFYVEGDTE